MGLPPTADAGDGQQPEPVAAARDAPQGTFGFDVRPGVDGAASPSGDLADEPVTPRPANRRARRARRPSSGRRLIAHDRGLGVRWVAGADEAGRGCLAGPLVTAAVLLDVERIGLREVRALRALNDSKQHTAQAREELYPVVMRIAARTAIVVRCAPGIDARGLHRTNLDALSDALKRVAVPDCVCLVDGFSVPDCGHEQRAIVNGDATSAAIAAASILAKVSRDRFMARADARHPGWAFADHMGYSTPVHRAAIQERGVSPLHRMSFQSTAYQQLAL